MNINIEPEKLYKIIRDSGKSNKEAIIRCVEMMAWEAVELCAAWEELIKISTNEKAEAKDFKEIKSKLFSEGAPLYGRLIHFYRNISTELGGKKSHDWIEDIYNRVAEVILHQADITKSLEGFNKTSLSQFPLFLSSQNDGREIKNLESSLQVLKNEVLTLKCLPETLKFVNLN